MICHFVHLFMQCHTSHPFILTFVVFCSFLSLSVFHYLFFIFMGFVFATTFHRFTICSFSFFTPIVASLLQHICRRAISLSTFWPFRELLVYPPFCQNLIFTATRSKLRVISLATGELLVCPLFASIFDPKRWTN